VGRKAKPRAKPGRVKQLLGQVRAWEGRHGTPPLSDQEALRLIEEARRHEAQDRDDLRLTTCPDCGRRALAYDTGPGARCLLCGGRQALEDRRQALEWHRQWLERRREDARRREKERLVRRQVNREVQRRRRRKEKGERHLAAGLLEQRPTRRGSFTLTALVEVKIACRHCGTPFRPQRCSGKFCSTRCRVAAWRAARP
jgi:hypothetical protein